MNTCEQNRERLALLALGALDAAEAKPLQSHLEACEICRQFRNEISAVAKTLSDVKTRDDIETSEVFHQSLARKIRAEKPQSLWSGVLEYLKAPSFDWRAALPAMGALALLIVSLAVLHSPNAPMPPKTVASNVSGLDHAAPPPTISSYQLAANESLEEFDRLLDRQAFRNPSHLPIYTAFARLPDL